jgi:hypothetical protein
LTGAGGKGIRRQVPGWAGQKVKKPPGKPGGLVWIGDDDAERQDQQHRLIMHNWGSASTPPQRIATKRHGLQSHDRLSHISYFIDQLRQLFSTTSLP